MTTSSLRNALITTQMHNYSIDYSKVTLKNYSTNVNNLNLYFGSKVTGMDILICIMFLHRVQC